MNKNLKKLEECMFKPLIFASSEDDMPKIIIICGSDVQNSREINPNGKIEEKQNTYVHIFNVTDSILLHKAIIETHNVSSFKKFFDCIEDIPLEEVDEDLYLAVELISLEMGLINNRLSHLGKALNSLKLIKDTYDNPDKDNSEDVGNLIIGSNETGGVAHIVYKIIHGDKMGKIDEEDQEKISGVISNVMSNHLNMDITSEEDVKKLKAEIEYKLIESLPATFKTENVEINIQPLLEQIKMIQNNKNKEENSDE